MISKFSSDSNARAYSYAQSSHNNGNIATQTNGVSSGRTQSYAYDNLSRILTAQSQATSGADCWGLSYGNGTTAGADALNNLLSISGTKCSNTTLGVAVNNNNQITNTGFSYDSAGNNTADGVYTYTFDAENRIVSASGMTGGPYCYTYDGNGMRVAKAHGASCTSSPPIDVLYWRSVSGGTIAESDSSGSTLNASYHEYIFFGGRRIARSDVSSGNIYFFYADHLSSTRAMTQANGTVCFASEYRPDGLELNTTSSCSTNYKFTGYERDPETGLDYAFARHYNPRLGRFMSADPLAGSASDPQSQNRYSYVRNNSTNLTDPSGACPAEYQDCGTFDWYHGDGSGRNGRGSSPSQLWGASFAQYLRQAYNAQIQVGPGGVLYALQVVHRKSSDTADTIREEFDFAEVQVGQLPGGGNSSGGFFSGLKDKFLDFLAAHANYLPGVCTAGVFGFGTGGVGNDKAGAEGGLLYDKQIGQPGTVQRLGEVGYGPIGVGGTPSEVLVFVQPAPKVPAGVVFAANPQNGFINNSGISIGVFAGGFGHKKGFAGGAGGGAYLTFSSAANCVKNF